MKISSDFVNDRGIPFVAVRLEPGEPFGRIGYGRRLVADRPLIEFYDRRHPDIQGGDVEVAGKPLGQFVARYYAQTLAEARGRGLLLDGGVSDWQVSAANMALVHNQLIAPS